MTQYFTRTTQVNLRPGEKLGFTTGKGYYAIPAPPPKAAAPAQQKPPVAPPPASTPSAGPARTPAAATPIPATPTPATSAGIPPKPAAARQPAMLAVTQPTAATTAPPRAARPERRATEHPIQPSPVTRAYPVVANHPRSHTTITKAHATSEIAKLTTTHGTITNITIHDAAPQKDWRTALKLALGDRTSPRLAAGPTVREYAVDTASGAPAAGAAAPTILSAGTRLRAATALASQPALDSRVRAVQGRMATDTRMIDPIADAHAPHPPKQWKTAQGRKKYAFDYLHEALRPDPNNDTRRLKPFQVAAIVGNLSYESTSSRTGKELVAGLHETGGKGIGIAQWTPTAPVVDIDRVDVLKRFASYHKLSWKNFGLELAYVALESNTGGKIPVEASGGKSSTTTYLLKDQNFLRKLSATTSIEEATRVVMDIYENPENSSSLGRRIEKAKEILNLKDVHSQ